MSSVLPLIYKKTTTTDIKGRQEQKFSERLLPS